MVRLCMVMACLIVGESLHGFVEASGGPGVVAAEADLVTGSRF
jgi:hypothetical protein